MQKKKLSLAARIGIAMVSGIVIGLIMYLVMGAESAGAIATAYIKPFGDIFINLLKFIVVPIVLLSLVDGMLSMRDIKKVGSIGAKTLMYFLCTTALACVVGLSLATLFKPLFPVLTDLSVEYQVKAAGTFMDTIRDIFPSNLWGSLTSANMLQVIVIALFLGSGVIVAGEKGRLAADVLSSFYEVFTRIMMFIISLAPIGVFCLMIWVVATQGSEILGSLAIVLLCAYIGYFLHALVVYSFSVRVFSGMNPFRFFRGMLPALVFAFSSSSSVATLPVSKDCCDKLGADKEISSFVLPLGATVNMDGTAIYQCVTAVFLAKCVGMDLSLAQMATIVATATLASIGTAGVSGAGMIMLAMVLETIGIDPTYIGMIYGIDRLFDMGRTAMNILGDSACAMCVSSWERKKAIPGNAEQTISKSEN